MVGFFLLTALMSPLAAKENPSAQPTSALQVFWGVSPEAETTRLALLSHGYDALLLRVHLIRRAQQSIDLQTFIWTNDECGRLLVYELIEAARRGVKVRIIADHLFSAQEPDLVAFLATVHPNFQVKHYRPATSRLKPGLWRTLVAGLMSFRAINQRMHSKVMLVDESILITGGRNVENTYFDHSPTLNFKDRDVLAIGPVVPTAQRQFEQFWSYFGSVSSRDLVDVDAVIRRGDYRRFPERSDYDFGGHFEELNLQADNDALIRERFQSRLKAVRQATFVFDPPGKRLGGTLKQREIIHDLEECILNARHSILLQTPYLILSPEARTLVRTLREKNPSLVIRVSTNSFASTDNLFAYSANYRLRNLYIEDLALEIHEMKPRPGCLPDVFPRHVDMKRWAEQRAAGNVPVPSEPFLSLHSKSFVIDDRVAFVGSFNLDPRSQNLNTEVGLLIEDDEFAAALRLEIENDLRPENSWVIGRRPLPLPVAVVNGMLESLLSIAPIDVWPLQNTTSFELRPGMEPVPLRHPEFHQRYRDVGSFPGSEGSVSAKEIVTRLYKAVGPTLTPLL